MKIVYIPGVWDLLHPGHLNVLQRAKQQGTYLIVGVCSDRLVKLHKGHEPLFNEHERYQLIKSLKDVDSALVYDNPDQTEVLQRYAVHVFAVGEEFGKQGVPEHANALRFCTQAGIPIIRLVRTPGISSGSLKQRVTDNARSRTISQFWQDRGRRAKTGELHSWQATSLTHSPEAAVYRCEQDLAGIRAALDLVPPPHNAILELGCGTGRITPELAKRYAHVYAYDFINDFLEIAKRHTAGFNNITYACADACGFDRKVKYDACLIAGLLLSLSDEQAVQLSKALRDIPKLVIKESVGSQQRFELSPDHFSKELNANYTAIYRSVDEIKQLFAAQGFTCVHDSIVAHHRAETHLHTFNFQKT